MSGSVTEYNESLCDIGIEVPSDKTPFIQEGHAVIGHIICELVEKKLFSKYKKQLFYLGIRHTFKTFS